MSQPLSHSTFQHIHVESELLANYTWPTQRHRIGLNLPCRLRLEYCSNKFLMSSAVSNLFTYDLYIKSNPNTACNISIPMSSPAQLQWHQSRRHVICCIPIPNLDPAASFPHLNCHAYVSCRVHSYFTTVCYTIIWQVMSSTASSRATIVNSRAHMLWALLSFLGSSLTWTCTFK